MKTATSLLGLIVLAMVATQQPALAQRGSREPSARDASAALRERVQLRYNVVPIANGIALSPKEPDGDVRLIEVSDTIAVNGTVVTGAELRDLLGRDADLVLQLSYMDREARQTLVPPPAAPVEPEREPARRDADDRVREAESRARDAATGRREPGIRRSRSPGRRRGPPGGPETS